MSLLRGIKNTTNFFMGTATYNPFVKVFLRSFDILPRLWFREFRGLPPNHLRCRVGVGGRVLANQVVHLTRGIDLWFYLMASGRVDFGSNIVEIGCGCGRRTHLISNYSFHGESYTGNYLGIDIDSEMLEWCRAHFDPERFEFVQSTHSSAAYKGREQGSRYRIPREDATQDLVFGTSVLTHLLEEQLREYFEEAARILKPGRTMAMTAKCIDLGARSVGNTYRHRIGPAYVENPEVPEAAVAYESEFLLEQARAAGFSDARVLHDDSDWQHTLVAVR